MGCFEKQVNAALFCIGLSACYRLALAKKLCSFGYRLALALPELQGKISGKVKLGVSVCHMAVTTKLCR